jgi:hypothetical protein
MSSLAIVFHAPNEEMYCLFKKHRYSPRTIVHNGFIRSSMGHFSHGSTRSSVVVGDSRSILFLKVIVRNSSLASSVLHMKRRILLTTAKFARCLPYSKQTTICLKSESAIRLSYDPSAKYKCVGFSSLESQHVRMLYLTCCIRRHSIIIVIDWIVKTSNKIATIVTE